MITLCPKTHKCPYTAQPADHIVLDDTITSDCLRHFVSSSAVKKFYTNLHYRLVVKLPVEARNKEILNHLAKLSDPLFVILKESVGTDVSQRQRFAQELIDLCMPVAAKTIALCMIQQYCLTKTIKDIESIRNGVWVAFADEANQRLALKNKKFKTCASLDSEELEKVYEFFFENLVVKLYKDFSSEYKVQKKKLRPFKSVSDPFLEENKAFEPFRKECQVISKVKNEKAMWPIQAPYATTADKFYEKKVYEYEIPKSVPDYGFNHFREVAKIQKNDASVELDFTANARNVTNTTFFTLFESLPKFDKLRSLSINVSGSQGFGAIGLGYLKTGLLKLNLEAFHFKADGCQGMNDQCVQNIVQGLSRSTRLANFTLKAPNCPAITPSSLVILSALADNNKNIRRLTVDISKNKSLTDHGLLSLRKLLDKLFISHLELHFDKCENVSKKGKENIRFFIRNCPRIGFYKLT